MIGYQFSCPGNSHQLTYPVSLKGLILSQVAHRTTKKVSEVILKKGDSSTAANNTELDNLAKCLQGFSPVVDELAMAAYPPMDQEALGKEVCGVCCEAVG